MGLREFLRGLDDKQRRDADDCAAVTAIGNDALRQPADVGDKRVMSVWLCALAAVGLDVEVPEYLRECSKHPHQRLWSEEICRRHVDAMQPAIAKRVREAVEMVGLYRSEHGTAQKEVSVRQFVAKVGRLEPILQSVEPPRRYASVGTAPDGADGEISGARKGIQRRVLVERHHNRWPTIESDLSDASTNGLAGAAKAGSRGWLEAEALEWANLNGRLTQAPEPAGLDAVMRGGFTSRRHTLAS